ncbi:MAG: hypothetical protein AAFP80_10060 [Pseudomonadota bacterium]
MATYVAMEAPNEMIDNLPEIEFAELRAKSVKDNIDEFVKHIHKIAEEERVLDCVGLYLLHKHHNDSVNKFLVRNYTENSMQVKLVDKSNDIIPASWMLAEDEEGNNVLLPTEWATDGRAKKQFDKIQNSDFLEKYASALKDAELEEVLGLTLSWADVMNVDADEILVEQTKFQEGDIFEANVVTPEKASSFSEDELIETNWFFGINKSCRCSRVPTYCVSWATYCVRYSPGHASVRRCTRRRLEHRRTCVG